MANKPVLFYGLEAIAAAGITEVGIIVGDTAAEIQEAVGDGSEFGCEVTYIRAGRAARPRPRRAHRPRLPRRRRLRDVPRRQLHRRRHHGAGRRFRADRPDAQILLTQVPDPTAFGVAELDADGRVVGLEEKPAKPKSDLALVGVYMFTPAIHEAVARSSRPGAASWRSPTPSSG